MSPRARQAKGKARLNAYEQLLAEDTAKKVDTVEIYIPPGPRLGDIVVEARGLKKAYGDTVLFDDLTFTLPRGGIVGVIGPNGAGKTTTFRLITGQEQPDGGTLRLGETVQIGYVDQSRDALDPEQDGVRRDHRRRRRTDDGQARRWRRAPTCRGSTSRAGSSSARSGRCRAASATACTWPSCCARAATCCCSTSRPTTSTSTRCARSKRRCCKFAGCAVVISHDRWFLDRIATHILAFEGDSQVGVVRRATTRTTRPIGKRRLGAAGRSAAPHQVPETHARNSRSRATMNPEQAKFLAATHRPAVAAEWMTTYKVIAAIPEGKKDWKPEASRRTAWEIAQHIADSDIGFLHAVAANDVRAHLSRQARRRTPSRNWRIGTSTSSRRASSRCWRSTARTWRPIVDVLRHEDAVGRPPGLLQQPHGSPPRPAGDLPAPDGRQGAGHLRRQRRRALQGLGHR